MASQNSAADMVLVPKHSKLTDKERDALLEKLNISLRTLPKILEKDPAIQALDAKVGDVIKIERGSRTAGNTVFYRRVVNA